MTNKNLSHLPDAIKKRDILFGVAKLSADSLRKMAKDFESANWLSDALDFYNQIQDRESISRIRSLGIAEGDVFLFLKASRLLDDLPEAGLLECAAKAESLGKYRYALRALEKLPDNNTAKASYERIRSLVSQDPDILAEEAAKVFIPSSEDELAEEDL